MWERTEMAFVKEVRLKRIREGAETQAGVRGFGGGPCQLVSERPFICVAGGSVDWFAGASPPWDGRHRCTVLVGLAMQRVEQPFMDKEQLPRHPRGMHTENTHSCHNL